MNLQIQVVVAQKAILESSRPVEKHNYIINNIMNLQCFLDHFQLCIGYSSMLNPFSFICYLMLFHLRQTQRLSRVTTPTKTTRTFFCKNESASHTIQLELTMTKKQSSSCARRFSHKRISDKSQFSNRKPAHCDQFSFAGLSSQYRQAD